MQRSDTVQVPWQDIDTVLLDMDGTLLDLAFDNFFWLELVPARYADAHGLDTETARQHVEQRYAQVVGTLPWYCVDHWTDQLGLNIRDLKSKHRHLIRFLPGAREFLDVVRSRVARLILVTNAHRAALEIKIEATGVNAWMDAVISSHDYRKPKEDAGFWQALADDLDLAPGNCLLIEDSVAVLGTARRYGIRHLVAVRRPDTRAARRDVDDFPAVDHVGELI